MINPPPVQCRVCPLVVDAGTELCEAHEDAWMHSGERRREQELVRNRPPPVWLDRAVRAYRDWVDRARAEARESTGARASPPT